MTSGPIIHGPHTSDFGQIIKRFLAKVGAQDLLMVATRYEDVSL